METIKVLPIALSVKMVIFSHLSDAQELAYSEDPIPMINRINFAKYLIGKYSDTTVEIDPENEYQEFINQHPGMKF
jgi:hypothetical protein